MSTSPDQDRSRRLEVLGITGIGEVDPGADLAQLILDAASSAGTPLASGDVVVVGSKVVSKAEGRTLDAGEVEVSPFAATWAARWGKDPAVTEVVLREAVRVVRQMGPVLITETRHGFVCANSGVDQSSSGAPGRLVLLPEDPDASARRLRAAFGAHGLDVAVIVTDTFGRPWREGQTDVAIGIGGMQPIRSYIGELDPHGHEFAVQAICVADELAAAAELVKGNLSRVPVAVVRGYSWIPDDSATIAPVLREASRDMFR